MNSDSYSKVRKQIRYRLARIKHRRWAWENWRKGFKFGPVQRWRCCDHTTPHHGQECRYGRPYRDAMSLAQRWQAEEERPTLEQEIAEATEQYAVALEGLKDR